MSFMMTAEFLNKHPNAVFVFGDNTIRAGTGGAAKLRHHPQSLGFITKRLPQNSPEAFYTPDDYEEVYLKEIAKLKFEMLDNPHKTYYISKVGAGLANKNGIWEKVINPTMKLMLSNFKSQIIWLWD